MARIRSLRPALLEEPAFGQAGVGPRALGYGLIQIADDDGRFRATPIFLKSRIFPYVDEVRPDDVELWLGALHRIGWVSLYVVHSETFGAIAGWTDKHSPTYQLIQRATPSDLPDTAAGEVLHPSRGTAQLFAQASIAGDEKQPAGANSMRPPGGIHEASVTEGKGVEGSGEEGETALRAGARANDSDLAQVVERSLEILRTCPRFVINDVTTRVQVENAIAAVPGADAVGAAHEAVVWASDPAWRKTNPGAVFLDCLRRQRRPGQNASASHTGGHDGPDRTLPRRGSEHPADRAIRELDDLIPGEAA